MRKMKLIALKDVCKINMGQSPNSSSYNDYGDGMPFFQGNADFGERYPITRVWCNTPTKIAQAEDILISVRAPIGALNYAKEECCIGRGLAAITPDRNKVSQDFIYWALKGKKAELNDKGNGSTFKAISRKILEETMIPDINFEQQHKCAENLEKIYGIIQNRRKELLALDDLIKARFVEMFGDPVTSLKGRKQVPFSEFMTDIKYGTSQPPQFSEDGEYKFIRATNIKKGRITEENMLRISEAEAAKIQKCKLLGNEIIIVRSGANTGDTCVVTTEYAENYAGYDIIITLDLTKANPVYFNELINTHYMEQIVKPLTARSAQPHLNTKQVQGMPMIVASMDEQNEFAVFVEQVHKSKLMFQKLHQKLNILQKKAGDI